MVRECGIVYGRTRDAQRRHLYQEELEKECYEWEFISYCKLNHKPIIYQRNGHLICQSVISPTSRHSLD